MKTVLSISLILLTLGVVGQRRDALINFSKPIKQDVEITDRVEFKIDHTNYCLMQYRKEKLTGIWMQIAGGGAMVVGAMSESNEAVIAGGAVVFGGFVIQMRSHRWLKQAYVYPKERGLTVTVRF